MKIFTGSVEFDIDTSQYVGIAPGRPGRHTAEGATVDGLRGNPKEANNGAPANRTATV